MFRMLIMPDSGCPSVGTIERHHSASSFDIILNMLRAMGDGSGEISIRQAADDGSATIYRFSYRCAESESAAIAQPSA